MPTISQRAVDLIVEYEVTSRKVYEKKYQHPEWPGESSGITIAIGYDLGYASRDKITRDWANRVSPEMLQVMLRCSGIHGDAARELLPSVRSKILIPWDDAIAVFMDIDVPDWIAQVCRAIPGANKLSPDCLGAVTSLAYNRGAGGFTSNKDRFSEMAAMRQHIMDGQLSKVPADFRAMKRLWPNSAGLRARRDAEAALFQNGIIASSPATTGRASEAPPKTTPATPITKGEIGTGAGTVITTGSAANDAINAGWPPVAVAALIVGGLLAGGIIWYLIRKHRDPLVARIKDRTVEVTP